MLSQFSYPIIYAQNFAKSVAFYEDHFDYIAAFEMDGFVILKRMNHEHAYLAIMAADHSFIPADHRQKTTGMMLNMPVKNIDEAYQSAYWEGLSLVSKPQKSFFGAKHFMTEDPNGILINVAENIPMEMSFDNLEEPKQLCHVQ